MLLCCGLPLHPGGFLYLFRSFKTLYELKFYEVFSSVGLDSWADGILSERAFPASVLCRVLTMFSSVFFSVPSFTFMFLTQLKLVLCNRHKSNFIFLHSFFSAPFLYIFYSSSIYFFASFLNIKCLNSCVLMFGSLVLSCWSMCLFLCLSHIVLVTVAL